MASPLSCSCSCSKWQVFRQHPLAKFDEPAAVSPSEVLEQKVGFEHEQEHEHEHEETVSHQGVLVAATLAWLESAISTREPSVIESEGSIRTASFAVR
jgi:hypothetical protein